MKVLIYMGGLGNQIFCYAFTQYMRKKYPFSRIFGIYNKKKLNEHYGLEINKWFNVKLPPQRWYATLLTFFLYIAKKATGWKGLLDTNQKEITNEKSVVLFALKMDKRYIPQGEWLKFDFSDKQLGNKNLDVLKQIENCNSVFVHVRRGDYLSPEYSKRFEGCCPLDYYNKAIEIVKCKTPNPVFFVFSDDMSWCRNNLNVDKPICVDWNRGNQSPIDMYLMSNCKAAIIANSTFSYWGARLGINKNIVIYPERWINPPEKVGDIFPDKWIKI